MTLDDKTRIKFFEKEIKHLERELRVVTENYIYYRNKYERETDAHLRTHERLLALLHSS